MRIIYNIIFTIFLFFYIPVFLFKKRRRAGIRIRLGIYDKSLISKLSGRKNIWVHAVSIGEVIAAAPLVESIRQRHPEYRIVFSTVTETGNIAAGRILSKDDIILYLPFDISFIVKKVVGYIKPSFLVITETEIWPNLILTAQKMGVKIFMVNGRISDNSFKRYRIAAPLLMPVLRHIDLFCMQTKEYSQRIISLGAYRQRVIVSGNMKFDSAFLDDVSCHGAEMLQNILCLDQSSRLMVAGSTHPGEEDMILNAYKRLKPEFPGLMLIIAPRHVERACEIMQTAQHLRLEAELFSRLSKVSSMAPGKIVVLDVIGRLKDIYSISDIVFVGGSLVKKGGQNMVEPAVFSKPIILGPYTYNFRDITDMFLKNQAVMIAKSQGSLEGIIRGLLKDESLAKRLGEKARSVVESNRGAAERTLKAIEDEGVFL
jgi:3-deoxy-D-manno-octulosonic-acid transferase